MSQQTETRILQLPRILAILIAENQDYSYVDKLGYVTSPDLAVYYLKEALRDFSSLLARGEWDNKCAMEEALKSEMKYVEKEVEEISRLRDPREIRLVLSYIAAKALAHANSLSRCKGGE